MLAPKNYLFSVAGLLIGAVAGYLIVQMNEPELALPGALAGAVAGLLLGGLLRTILRR